MNYTTLDAQLQGRNKNRKKLANNTYAYRHNGAIGITLHSTEILTFNQDGTIVANSGGYRTHTTKDRLNQYLPCRIWQTKGQWLVSHGNQQVVFADGMTLHPDGSITGAATETQQDETKKLRKHILNYSNALTKALPLPMPGNGDCWFCMMRDQASGLPLGEATKNTDHLLSHLEDAYFVPSLVWRALEFSGCNPQGGGCAWFEVAFGSSPIGDKATIGRMVRKYLYRQLGV